VYRPDSEFMANTLRDLLEQGGIPAMIHSFQIPAYDGLARVMRPVWGELLVEEQDWEKAQEVIEGFLAAEGDTPGADG
jgi:hypothetical protein